ncbi:50S ribosomal protein L14e [Candidatus Woesearchaeota archaeon]|nr:MAG: 50S ribosomal protein L14e [Candidatus Woesearchaeota archaeon]
MLNVGRVCIKLAGRDAGRLAVVVENIDNNSVLIDGNVRRRKCNIRHLEPTKDVVDIKEKASSEDVLKALKKAGLEVVEKKESKKENKQKSERPRKQRKGSEKKSVPQPEKKVTKKKSPKKEDKK